ncbi:hypothetical protein ACHAWO_001548 [Cyclotella atomus]|uniref:Uncharacterized protein n=1 Tax=Cyclotella atomus TaxID=382360 RepID=A0ABD3PMD2_9STRA
MPSSCTQHATVFNTDGSNTDKRRISFATVSIREYDQTIGDSPFCLNGAPITLDWSFQEIETISVDQYEHSRQPFRRCRGNLILEAQERRMLLVESGLSLSVVIRAENRRKHDCISLKPAAARKEDRSCTASVKELKCKRTPTCQRRSFPQLQKQMASRAA